MTELGINDLHKKVSNLFAQNKESEEFSKALKDLQQKCKHHNIYIKFYEQNEEVVYGVKLPLFKTVCTFCGKIRYLTKKQAKVGKHKCKMTVWCATKEFIEKTPDFSR